GPAGVSRGEGSQSLMQPCTTKRPSRQTTSATTEAWPEEPQRINGTGCDMATYYRRRIRRPTDFAIVHGGQGSLVHCMPVGLIGRLIRMVPIIQAEMHAAGFGERLAGADRVEDRLALEHHRIEEEMLLDVIHAGASHDAAGL